MDQHHYVRGGAVDLDDPLRWDDPCGDVEHLGELHDDFNGDLNDDLNDDGGPARESQ